MDDLALALQLADIADQLSLARFRASDLVIDSKPDLTPVSDADKKILMDWANNEAKALMK